MTQQDSHYGGFMRRSRIDWHGSETDKLADLVFQMRLNDTSSTLLQLLSRAQQQLPEERRRKIASLKLVPWLEPAISERVNDLKNKANKSSQIKTIPQPPPPTNISKILEDMSTEEFFLTLARRLCQSVESLDLRLNQRFSRLENLLSQLINRPITTQQANNKPKKIKIVIAGLLPDQCQEIERTCNGHAELNFMRKDQDGAEIPVCDFVILSKFINHRWSDKAKLTMPKDRIFFIDGGVSSIIKKVFELGSRQ